MTWARDLISESISSRAPTTAYPCMMMQDNGTFKVKTSLLGADNLTSLSRWLKENCAGWRYISLDGNNIFVVFEVESEALRCAEHWSPASLYSAALEARVP